MLATQKNIMSNKPSNNCFASRISVSDLWCRGLLALLFRLSLAILVAAELHGSLWDIVYEYIPSYGNYCGPNMTYGGPDSLVCPLPIDEKDAACAAHDYLYSHTTESDYFPRALADLKLTGSFLTTPATSLKSLTYLIAGSIAMPIQSIRWTSQGIRD